MSHTVSPPPPAHVHGCGVENARVAYMTADSQDNQPEMNGTGRPRSLSFPRRVTMEDNYLDRHRKLQGQHNTYLAVCGGDVGECASFL